MAKRDAMIRAGNPRPSATAVSGSADECARCRSYAERAMARIELDHVTKLFDGNVRAMLKTADRATA